MVTDLCRRRFLEPALGTALLLLIPGCGSAGSSMATLLPHLVLRNRPHRHPRPPLQPLQRLQFRPHPHCLLPLGQHLTSTMAMS